MKLVEKFKSTMRKEIISKLETDLEAYQKTRTLSLSQALNQLIIRPCYPK